jgi:hypothetical protein
VVGWEAAGAEASLRRRRLRQGPACIDCEPTPVLPPLVPPCRCSSAVHSVLASLPRTTPADLDRFRRQLLGLNSEKAQRDLTKRMLVGRRCCCCCCCCCCASGRVLCLWFVSLRGGRVGPTGDVLAAPSRAP